MTASNDTRGPADAGPVVPSRGEIEALVRKAARGAGMSWGMADETAFAVRRLETWGVPGADLAVALFDRLDGAVGRLQPARPLADLTADGGPLCPIGIGVRFADARHLLHDEPLALPSVYCAALLLPFLALAAGGGGSVALDIGGREVRCGVGGLAGPVPAGDRPSGPLTVRRAGPLAAPRPATGPRPVDAGVWSALAAYAARTYVPASETSRLTGAGAGTSDND
ncbi:hypothetical protein DLJ53_09775 [Acuticoccus sediminis]|uniref:DUF3726 domain-containing protein n=1 Tax=Acuticoccus sediminis TaxID=2184697 RepID=A0A8B2NWE3_9HYPH|nr:DUF3726 domain-containing protein [Acuticoccus sediminis]RAI01692.1 hypothetical protein DLJ53_09775 [Acuticoccus sediminis]